MKSFFGTFFLGLGLIATFNYSRDSAFHWHSIPFEIEKEMLSTECLSVPGNFTEWEVKLAQLKTMQTPDLVIMGSSRMMQVTSDMFGDDLKTYNMGFSGSVVESYVVNWQQLKELNKLPKYLIIGLDPWVVNDNWFETVKAKGPGLVLLEHFFKGKADQNTKSLGRLTKNFVRRANEFGDEITELLSWTVTKANFHAPLALPAAVDKTKQVKFVKIADRPKNQYCWRSDGSLIYSASAAPVRNLEEVRQYGRGWASDPNVYGFSHWHFNSSEMSLFKLLIEDIGQSGVKVLVISPPFHKLALEVIYSRADYAEAIPQFENAMNEAKVQNPKFEFCNAIAPEKSGCEEIEFLDGMHPLGLCMARVMQYCLNQSSPMMDRINKSPLTAP